MARAEKSYEGSKREFPKAGTPEYEDLKSRAVAVPRPALPVRSRRRRSAASRSRDEEVDKRLEQIKKENFEGKDEEFDKALEKRGPQRARTRARQIHGQILQEKLFEKVTKEVEA